MLSKQLQQKDPLSETGVFSNNLLCHVQIEHRYFIHVMAYPYTFIISYFQYTLLTYTLSGYIIRP